MMDRLVEGVQWTIIGLLICVLAWTKPLRRQRTLEEINLELQTREVMSKRRRERWVFRYMQFGVSEWIEEAYYAGKITEEERDLWLQKFGSKMQMLDLLPRNSRIRFPDPKQLKEAIQLKRARSRQSERLRSGLTLKKDNRH